MPRIKLLPEYRDGFLSAFVIEPTLNGIAYTQAESLGADDWACFKIVRTINGENRTSQIMQALEKEGCEVLHVGRWSIYFEQPALKQPIEYRTQDNTARHFKGYLAELTTSVASYLTQLDTVMRLPQEHTRGRHIAKLSNVLQLTNDRARYFGLRLPFKTEKKEDA